MKKIILILLVAAVAVGGYFVLSKKEAKVEAGGKPVVKIGVIGPFTGDGQIIGQNCRQAVEFALENIKNSEVEYKLIFEDDVWQSAKALMAANKLVNMDKVDVLFTCSAPTGSSVVATSRDSKKFMMGVIASPPEIATESPYSFLHWTSPKVEGEKAAEFAVSKGAKKVVIFEQNHVGAKALGDAYRDALSQKGVQETTFTYMANERNFYDIVAKAERENADLFMMLTLPPSIDIIFKTLKEKGINTPITSIEAPTLIEDKSAFEGVEFVDVYDGKPEVMDEYKKKYNTNNTYGVAFAYDAMMIVNKVINDFYIKEKRIPDAEEMTNSMFVLKNWDGAVGKVVINPNKILDSEAVVKKIVDGKVVVVEE